MKKITQAVILAGGWGKRLQPLTLHTPKPLIPIHDKPFAAYLVELLKKNEIEEIIFLTGFEAGQFPAYFGDGSKFGLSIKYDELYDGENEVHTGERLRHAAPLFDEEFLLLYGDNYWPLHLDLLLAQYEKVGAPALVTVYERNDPTKKNNMLVGESGLVEVYDKKRETVGLNGVDIGFFILNKNILDLLPSENANFEATVLPKLIADKKLAGFLTKQPYWGLTDMERLPGVERALDPNRKVLFLDRDGVINRKPARGEYIKSVQEFEFLPGAKDALAQLSKKGYEFYIISNQAGIARGVMSEKDLADIQTYMQKELREAGVEIKHIYYCPHGWDEGCECRKPKPGMLYQAAREHDIDLSRAIFIGDDDRDGQAAEAANTPFIQVSPDIGIAGASL